MHITTRAVLDEDWVFEQAKISEVKNPSIWGQKEIIWAGSESMWHVNMHLRVWMILDVMSTYGMLKCCVWDPLGLKQGGKSRWNYDRYVIHYQAAE